MSCQWQPQLVIRKTMELNQANNWLIFYFRSITFTKQKKWRKYIQFANWHLNELATSALWNGGFRPITFGTNGNVHCARLYMYVNWWISGFCSIRVRSLQNINLKTWFKERNIQIKRQRSKTEIQWKIGIHKHVTQSLGEWWRPSDRTASALAPNREPCTRSDLYSQRNIRVFTQFDRRNPIIVAKKISSSRRSLAVNEKKNKSIFVLRITEYNHQIKAKNNSISNSTKSK